MRAVGEPTCPRFDAMCFDAKAQQLLWAWGGGGSALKIQKYDDDKFVVQFDFSE